jgi:aspartate aminotransferase
MAIAAKATSLAKQGIDVVSLSAGEPDFGTVESAARAGVKAIEQGQTRYTAASGTPELRAAGAAWLNRSFGTDFTAAEVMVTAGAKPALHMALMAILEAGDRVLLPAPYWVSYPSLVRIAGGEPIDIPAVPEQAFVHSGAQVLAAAREHGAKGIMLNFPNNPSGAVPSRGEMEAIVEACRTQDMWIVSDEIYGTMLYDGAEHVSPATLAKDRTLVVNGGSKSHSLTGWRVGFLAGPAAIIEAAGKIQSQVIGNPSSISQAAGLAACTADDTAELRRRVAAYDERRQYLVAALGKLDGIRVRPPAGAFYVMADVRDLCQRLGVDDMELAARLLEEVHLALVPGTPFAAPGFIRLSYAASMADLERAVARLGEFLERNR